MDILPFADADPLTESGNPLGLSLKIRKKIGPIDSYLSKWNDL